MQTNPIPTEPESLAALHQQNARHLCALLLRMAEQGAVMAGVYAQQAVDQADVAKPGAGRSAECAAAYASVTRSVRRTTLLIQKLTETPAPKLVQPAGEPRVAPGVARKQLIRRVENAIYTDAPDGEAADLHGEFLERLEGLEFEDELGQRPVQEIVNEIRADLGIHGPESLRHFKRRTPADITVLRARAANPGQAVRGAPFDAAMAAAHPGAAANDPAELVAALLRGGQPIRGP